jgi:hypothetical protein
MPKKISSLNLIVYGSIAVLFSMLIVLGFSPEGLAAASFGAFEYYFGIVISSLREALLFALYFLIIFLVFLVAVSNAKNLWNALRRNGKMPMMLGKSSVREAVREAFGILWKGLSAIAPAIFFVVLLSVVLSRINALDRFRLVDVRAIGLEYALFGNYVFAALGNFRYPSWFLNTIIFSFENMSGAVIITAFIICAFHHEKLRELVATFCLSMFLSVVMWIVFPALSPQDRFIDNVYKLPVPTSVLAAIQNYHPQREISDFLLSVRKEKAELVDLPTSTIPSAHIIWAVLAGYYLWRTRRWLGWIALPFLIASSFGTVLFAQHYFIDIPLALLISGVSVWIVEKLVRLKN